MALNAKDYKQESKFKEQEPLGVGAYPARLVQVLSLGLQKQQPWQGEEKPPKDEIYVTYELLDEFMLDEDGNEIEDKPRWISEDFTMNSLESDLAKSTKRYYSLDPEEKFGGRWDELIGAPCMVNIVQNKGKGKNEGRVFNNVASISSMRDKEAAKAPKLVNEGKVFDIDDPDMETFLSLPKFLQDKMRDNLEYGGSALEKAIQAHIDGGGTLDKQKKEDAPEKGSEKVSDTKETDSDDDGW